MPISQQKISYFIKKHLSKTFERSWIIILIFSQENTNIYLEPINISEITVNNVI